MTSFEITGKLLWFRHRRGLRFVRGWLIGKKKRIHGFDAVQYVEDILY